MGVGVRRAGMYWYWSKLEEGSEREQDYKHERRKTEGTEICKLALSEKFHSNALNRDEFWSEWNQHDYPYSGVFNLKFKFVHLKEHIPGDGMRREGGSNRAWSSGEAPGGKWAECKLCKVIPWSEVATSWIYTSRIIFSSRVISSHINLSLAWFFSSSLFPLS